VDWLIVVASSFLLLPLYAAFIVTTATAISPATLPALVMASLFGVTTALLLVTRKHRPQISELTILLPVAVTVAIVLPVRLLRLQEFEAFAGTLIMLLTLATAFNLAVVPQMCAWADRWRPSGQELNKVGRAAQPREDFGDDIL
jgi:Na+-translocating ferredoxin:NAD+ oxidoreductase RnfA subunit